VVVGTVMIISRFLDEWYCPVQGATVIW